MATVPVRQDSGQHRVALGETWRSGGYLTQVFQPLLRLLQIGYAVTQVAGAEEQGDDVRVGRRRRRALHAVGAEEDVRDFGGKLGLQVHGAVRCAPQAGRPQRDVLTRIVQVKAHIQGLTFAFDGSVDQQGHAQPLDRALCAGAAQGLAVGE